MRAGKLDQQRAVSLPLFALRRHSRIFWWHLPSLFDYINIQLVRHEAGALTCRKRDSAIEHMISSSRADKPKWERRRREKLRIDHRDIYKRIFHVIRHTFIELGGRFRSFLPISDEFSVMCTLINLTVLNWHSPLSHCVMLSVMCSYSNKFHCLETSWRLGNFHVSLRPWKVMSYDRSNKG